VHVNTAILENNARHIELEHWLANSSGIPVR